MVSSRRRNHGAIDGGGGGVQCRVSNLGNGGFACLLTLHVPCRLYDALMSHVLFKKCPESCHYVLWPCR